MKNQAKHFQEQSLTVVPYQKEGQSASHYKIHKHKHTQTMSASVCSSIDTFELQFR